MIMSYERWLVDIQPELKTMYEKFKKVAVPEEKWKYDVIGDTHVVAVSPLDIRVRTGAVRGVDVKEDNYMNISFVWWEDYPINTRPYVTSMLVYLGRVYSNKQPNGFWSGEFTGKGVPTPTFIIYKDGTVSVETVNDLSGEGDKIHLATTIVKTNPEISTVGFVPYVSWNSVAYAANRIGIFYRKMDNKVLLVYRPSTTIERFHQTGRNLGADFGGSLDSGGSANFRVGGTNINMTSRWMAAGINW